MPRGVSQTPYSNSQRFVGATETRFRLRGSISALLLTASFIFSAHANELPMRWEDLLRHGDPALQAKWGLKYEHADGVARNYERALSLYCAAARDGNTDAQYRLGWMYANARGVARDKNLAAAWFRLAADEGDRNARKMLALMGRTTPREATCRNIDAKVVGLTSGSGSKAQRTRIESWVRRLAPLYGLDEKLVLLLIKAESNFDPRARSHKNAQGLMQLMPQTAKRFGVSDPMNPLQNLHGGMAYLRWLLARFEGDVRLALAGYNAGEAAVEKYRGVPPYRETRAYVKKILRRYGRSTHPPVAQVVEPSAILVTAMPALQ